MPEIHILKTKALKIFLNKNGNMNGKIGFYYNMGIKRALWRQANFKQHSIAVKFFMKVEQKNYGNRKFRLQWRWCRRKRESPINFNVSVFMPSPSASFIYSTLHTLLCKSRLSDANSACIKLMGLKVRVETIPFQSTID